MKIIEYAKAHPWQTGIVVVIGGVVFLVITGVLGGKGSSEGSGGSSKPSDAEIAANAAIQAAQINAQATAAAAGAQLQLAQLGAGVQMNSDNLNSQVAMRQLDVARELGLADTEANRQLGLASTQAQADVAKAQIAGQVETNRIIASGQKSSSKSSAIGGIVGGLLGIFSDERVKENIVRVGTTRQGHGIYEYNYKGDKVLRRGVIAQEVRKKNPEAVIENQQGLLRLNSFAVEASV